MDVDFKKKGKKYEKEEKRPLAQIRALKPRQLRRKRCQGRMDVRGIVFHHTGSGARVFLL